MGTYTYTLPANASIGSYTNGIKLAPNECISYYTFKMSSSGLSINNVTLNDTDMVYVYITNYSLSLTDSSKCEEAFGFSGARGVTKPFHNNYQNTNYISSPDITRLLLGENIVIHVGSKYKSYSSGSIILLDPVEFTIYTTTIPFNISYSVNPSAGGSVSGLASGPRQYGAELDYTATPNTGYVFDRWTCSVGTISNYLNPSMTYTVGGGDDTIVAHFAQRTDSSPKAGRYNGEAYDQVDIYQYNGSSWVQCEAKRYNGSSWDSVDTL